MLITSSSVYFYSLNIIRQGLMTPFLIISLYFLTQDNRRKSILYLFIGALFHITAILFLPIILLYPKYKQWNKPLSGMVIALALSIFINKYTMLFLIKFSGIPFLIRKATNYFHKPYFQSTIFEPSILIKLFIIGIILVALKRVYCLHHDEQFNHLYLAVCLFFHNPFIFQFINYSKPIIVECFNITTNSICKIHFWFSKKNTCTCYVFHSFFGLWAINLPTSKSKIQSKIKKVANYTTINECMAIPKKV